MNDFDWAMKAHNAVNEMDRDTPGLSGPTITFMTGAKWQREQLLSQESVSKAAASLCRHEYPFEEDFQYHWENFNSLYIEKATTALAATLLGED